jgi:hypothetical protein
MFLDDQKANHTIPEVTQPGITLAADQRRFIEILAKGKALAARVEDDEPGIPVILRGPGGYGKTTTLVYALENTLAGLEGVCVFPTHSAKFTAIKNGANVEAVDTLAAAVYQLHIPDWVLTFLENWLEHPIEWKLNVKPYFAPEPPPHKAVLARRVFAETTSMRAALQAAGVDQLELRDRDKGKDGFIPKPPDPRWDFIWVDECSMITETEAQDLLTAAKLVVFSGDLLQIPPVVAGQEMRDGFGRIIRGHDGRPLRKPPPPGSFSALVAPKARIPNYDPALNAALDIPKRQKTSDPGGAAILEFLTWFRDQIKSAPTDTLPDGKGGKVRRVIVSLEDTLKEFKNPKYSAGLSYRSRSDKYQTWPQPVMCNGGAITFYNSSRIGLYMSWHDTVHGIGNPLQKGDPLMIRSVNRAWFQGMDTVLPAGASLEDAGLLVNARWFVSETPEPGKRVRIQQYPPDTEPPEWVLLPHGLDVSLLVADDGADAYERFRTGEWGRPQWAPYRELHRTDEMMHGLTVRLGAAITAHQSQGAEWPEVAVCLGDITSLARTANEITPDTDPLDQLPLWVRVFYTACSRAKHHIYLVDESFAFRVTPT